MNAMIEILSSLGHPTLRNLPLLPLAPSPDVQISTAVASGTS